MAFSDFAYPDVIRQLGLTYETADDLFAAVPSFPPTAAMREVLGTTTRLATINNNEKARSEWIIGLLLADVWGRCHGRVGLYSGVEFPADPAAGLSGFLDFAFCRSPQSVSFTPPVLLVFEAKRDNINDGLGQCVAGLVGTQRYNRRQGIDERHLYGCVTTGSLWRFMRLTDTTLTFDLTEYNLGQLERILGVIVSIVAPPLAVSAAA
jgi:hypothetical protein